MLHSSGSDEKRFSISPALRQALISASARHRASLDVLRDAICEYVDDLRGQGVASHEIASTVRRRVTELRLDGDEAAPERLADGLVDEMVTDCLDGAG